jgi:hypothetical protein
MKNVRSLTFKINIYYQNILFNMEQIYNIYAFIHILSFTTEFVCTGRSAGEETGLAA